MQVYIASARDDLGGPRWSTIRRLGAGLLFCKGGDELGVKLPGNWQAASVCRVNDCGNLSPQDAYGVMSGLSSIIRFLEDGRPVVFRCQAGVSRSTAFAVAALVKSGRSPEDAAARLLAVRPEAHPNEAICRFADAAWGMNGEIIRAGGLTRQGGLWSRPDTMKQKAARRLSLLLSVRGATAP